MLDRVVQHPASWNAHPTMPGQPVYQVAHDQSITMPLPMGMDPDGDPLTLQLVSGVSHGTLTLNGTATFTYTPSFHYVGADSFQVRFADPLGAVSPIVTISLNVTNAAPVFMTPPGPVSVPETAFGNENYTADQGFHYVVGMPTTTMPRFCAGASRCPQSA